MKTLKLLKPKKSQMKGQSLHQCVLCSPEASETNSVTNETNWYGRPYPDSMLVNKDGKYFCIPHYRWRYGPQASDEAKLSLKEERQGLEKGSV